MLRHFGRTWGALFKAESHRRSAPRRIIKAYERPMFWATFAATVAVSVSVVVSACSAAISAWNTYYVGKQVAEMWAEQRAWIGAPKITPRPLSSRGKWRFDYELENVGRLPPSGTHFGTHLFPVTKVDVSQSKGESEKDCKAGLDERRQKPEQYKSFSVVPGSSLKLRDIDTGVRSKPYSRHPNIAVQI